MNIRDSSSPVAPQNDSPKGFFRSLSSRCKSNPRSRAREALAAGFPLHLAGGIDRAEITVDVRPPAPTTPRVPDTVRPVLLRALESSWV